jgi:hypothetical protein
MRVLIYHPTSKVMPADDTFDIRYPNGLDSAIRGVEMWCTSSTLPVNIKLVSSLRSPRTGHFYGYSRVWNDIDVMVLQILSVP